MTKSRVYRAIVVAGILIFAVNLRAAVVAISPLLHQIQTGLGLSGGEAGLLTTLPVACFGLFSPLAPELSRRIGIERTLFCAMLLIVGAFALRLVPATFPLFAGTLLAGVGIAIGNVLIPVLIKRDFTRTTGTMTAAYIAALSFGPALAAGLTIPLQRHFGLDWRHALFLWVALPLLTLFMGFQSLGFYSTVAWLPTLYIAHGVDAATAGGLLSLANVVSLPVVLIVPLVSLRMRDQTGLVWLMGALNLAGLLGILLDPVPLAVLWVILVGAAQAMTISLAITFIMARSPDGAHAAQLSSMAQGIGYVMAAFGPFLFGLIRDWSDGYTMPMIALVAVLVPLVATGLGAAQPRFVGMARAA